MESELSYESQVRVAFFKGDLGGLLDTSSAEVDLDSVVIHPEDVGEGQEEEDEGRRGIVVSSSQITVRGGSSSVVLENPCVIPDDTIESVPPNSPVITVESAGQCSPIESGRESMPQKVQVVMEVPSGVIIENPSASEEGRDTTSLPPPGSQVIVDDLQGVIVENLSAQREADINDTAPVPQMPISEATVTDEQGCVIPGNPDAQVEGREDTTLTRRPHSGRAKEGNLSFEDQVLHGASLVIL